MNRILIAGCILAGISLNACSSKQPDHDSSIVPAGAAQSLVTTANDTTPVPATVVSTNPAAAAATNVTTTASPAITTTQASPATTTTAPGMNPPHGQPGHRCDISVGAPLNSPAAAKTQPAATTAPVATSTPVINTTTTTTPAVIPSTTPATNAAGQKLNPPHGQPGHDCTIAVGQPLKN